MTQLLFFSFIESSSTDVETPPFYENYTQVGVNFGNDFIRSATGPRDILIIVDASGSITAESLTVSRICQFFRSVVKASTAAWQ